MGKSAPWTIGKSLQAGTRTVSIVAGTSRGGFCRASRLARPVELHSSPYRSTRPFLRSGKHERSQAAAAGPSLACGSGRGRGWGG